MGKIFVHNFFDVKLHFSTILFELFKDDTEFRKYNNETLMQFVQVHLNIPKSKQKV